MEYEIIYHLTEAQIMNLLELYQGESWCKDRKIDDVRKMLNYSWVIALVDCVTGRIIAFSRVISDFVYRAFIYDVIVAKEYRGMGFGKQIVNLILESKEIRDVERIELNCIDRNIPFYKKLGFDKVPEGTNMMRYYRN